MYLATPPAPQERLPRPQTPANQRVFGRSKENECTSPIRSGGYGSPASEGSSPLWQGPSAEKYEKAWLNQSPSAASTTVPLEVTRPESFYQSGPLAEGPMRLAPEVDSPRRTLDPPSSPSGDWQGFYNQWLQDQESFQHCTESQAKLLKATQWAAKHIGSGHEAVEAAKQHIQQLRSRQHRMRFNSNLRWHKANLAFELQQLAHMKTHKEESFQAAAHAAEVDLGPAHEVVANARRMAQTLKLRKVHKARKDREAKQDLEVRAAAESKDLHALAGSIQVAAQKLGAAHEIVERGRQEFLQQRRELQRQQWEECVHLQQALMVEACESQDPEQIEARILAASHSPLGQGHEIVLYGKRYLLWLRRAMQRRALEARQSRCVKVLLQASQEATEAEVRSMEIQGGDFRV